MNYNSVIAPAASTHVGPHQRRKLVIVGPGGCGKTSLLMVYARGSFPTEYVPTVFENYVTEVVSDKRIVDLALWDTAGQEDYDRLRPLSYPDTDVVLLCFAADSREQFDSILKKWNPEVDHFCEGAPKILVALKTDLRAEGEKAVSAEEGQELAYKIGAYRYVECSAKMRDGVDVVFDTSVKAIWEREKRSSRQRRRQAFKRIVRCSVM
jgi:Ras family protein A